MDKLRDDIDSYISMLFMLPGVLYAIHISQSYFGQQAETTFRVVFSIAAGVCGLVFIIYKLVQLQKRLDQFRIGYDAELAVGQELDQLMRQGAAVFHDFPADKFNIDHIVISPVGIFAVETKGRAKPVLPHGKTPQIEYDGRTLKFPGWVENKPLQQTERQAKWLQNWLTSAVGEPVGVKPVLAFPGWYVKRTSRNGVAVFSGRELSGLLKSSGFTQLANDKMQRVIHQVEQRCRNVEPTFQPQPKT